MMRAAKWSSAAGAAVLCVVTLLCPAAAGRSTAGIDHALLVKHVMQIFENRGPGRVEKWTRPLTFAISANENKARSLWGSPFTVDCAAAHIECRELPADQIESSDVQVYVLDDLAPTLVKFKPLINRIRNLSDMQYLEWAKKITESVITSNASYQTFVSDEASLQKILIFFPTSIYEKKELAERHFARMALRALTHAGNSEQSLPSLLSTEPSPDIFLGGITVNRETMLDLAFLEAWYDQAIPYRAPARDIVSKLVEFTEARLSARLGDR